MRLGGAVRTRVWEGLLERRGDLGTKESEREGWLQKGDPREAVLSDRRTRRGCD